MNAIENFILEKDLEIFCVTADTYPEGIFPAFQKLHSLIPFHPNRHYISLSRPEGEGKIIYRAGAAELIQGDLQALNLEKILVKRGKYYCIVLHDYRKDIAAIGETFKLLTHLPDIDPEGYCVEWYTSETEMKCLIRINS